MWQVPTISHPSASVEPAIFCVILEELAGWWNRNFWYYFLISWVSFRWKCCVFCLNCVWIIVYHGVVTLKRSASTNECRYGLGESDTSRRNQHSVVWMDRNQRRLLLASLRNDQNQQDRTKSRWPTELKRCSTECLPRSMRSVLILIGMLTLLNLKDRAAEKKIDQKKPPLTWGMRAKDAGCCTFWRLSEP